MKFLVGSKGDVMSLNVDARVVGRGQRPCLRGPVENESIVTYFAQNRSSTNLEISILLCFQ